MEKAKKELVDRRQFLGTTAKGVSAILAFPTIISSKALAGTGGRGGVAPSDRIVFGSIGIGGQGTNDMNDLISHDDVVFVAHCNVQKARRESIKQLLDTKYKSNIDTYIDFRELLARKDIDAVLITTGDRNHAMLSVNAMRAGKDVYCEKPGTLTIREGQVLRETQKRYGRVYQGGMQRLNESNFIFANELYRLGRLGKVGRVHAQVISGTTYMVNNYLPADVPEPPKEEFWWDAWLGATTWRPYNSSYAGSGNIHDLDFYNGNIGEWGSHTFPQCQDAISCRDASPVEYKFPNNTSGEGMVTRFANGIEMILSLSVGQCGVKYEGTEGWVQVADGQLNVSAPSLLSDYTKIVADYRERTGRRGDHKRDLLDCIRSRRLTVADAELTANSMASIQIANICMWLKRDMKWDPIKEEFINDDAANRMRSRAQREPWAFV